MRAFIAIIVLLVLGVAAYAETITYKYDARGRLIQVTTTNTVTNNVVVNYTYDKADNRQLKNTTGP